MELATARKSSSDKIDDVGSQSMRELTPDLDIFHYTKSI